MRNRAMALAFAMTAATTPAVADSTAARCDIYPAGSDHADRMIPCTFGQRQGNVSITREDGVTHELEPVGDAPGTFNDQRGRRVYRSVPRPPAWATRRRGSSSRRVSIPRIA